MSYNNSIQFHLVIQCSMDRLIDNKFITLKLLNKFKNYTGYYKRVESTIDAIC